MDSFSSSWRVPNSHIRDDSVLVDLDLQLHDAGARRKGQRSARCAGERWMWRGWSRAEEGRTLHKLQQAQKTVSYQKSECLEMRRDVPGAPTRPVPTSLSVLSKLPTWSEAGAQEEAAKGTRRPRKDQPLRVFSAIKQIKLRQTHVSRLVVVVEHLLVIRSLLDDADVR